MFRKQNLRPSSKNVFDLIRKHFLASDTQNLLLKQTNNFAFPVFFTYAYVAMIPSDDNIRKLKCFYFDNFGTFFFGHSILRRTIVNRGKWL